MLNCRQVTVLCSQEHERPLTLRERLALRMHLMMCVGCTRFRKQINFIDRAADLFFRSPGTGSRNSAESKD